MRRVANFGGPRGRMRIYAFAEHYPNTFKPYYDAQLAQLLDDGHEVRVFAFGRFDSTRNATTDAYGLDRLTSYCPSTLRTLPETAPALARAIAAHPRALGRRLAAALDREQSPKQNLLDAARALGLPERPPDVCLIHNLVTAQSFGFLRRLYPGARVAMYFHGGEIPQGGSITRSEAARAFRRVHRVFTNTAYSRAEALRRGCPPEKVSVVPVGFRIGDYRPPAHKRYREGGLLRLVVAGRVSVEKGLGHALDAVALLRCRGVDGFRLRIIGRGPMTRTLRERVAAERLAPHVELVGELPHHAVVEQYLEADALLLPSIPTEHWEENQACVMQEAMLMKLLVVASRTGGVEESLAPGLRRFLVAPGDGAAIASRVEELLGLGDEELRRLGQHAREFAAKDYDVRDLNARLLEDAMARSADGTARAAAAQA